MFTSNKAHGQKQNYLDNKYLRKGKGMHNIAHLQLAMQLHKGSERTGTKSGFNTTNLLRADEYYIIHLSTLHLSRS